MRSPAIGVQRSVPIAGSFCIRRLKRLSNNIDRQIRMDKDRRKSRIHDSIVMKTAKREVVKQ